MFENPIQGSVGSACKRVAGIIYGVMCLIALLVFILNCAPMFNEELLNAFTKANGASFPTIITVLMQRLILNGKQDVAKVFYYLVVFGSAFWQGFKLWLFGYGAALICNVVGDWTNSFAIIANRMPKTSPKE